MGGLIPPRLILQNANMNLNQTDEREAEKYISVWGGKDCKWEAAGTQMGDHDLTHKWSWT